MTVLGRVPVDKISARAAQIDAGRTLLRLLGGLLFLLAFLPAKGLRMTWTSLVWAGAAVAVGWSEGWMKPTPTGGTDG